VELELLLALPGTSWEVTDEGTDVPIEFVAVTYHQYCVPGTSGPAV